MLNVECLVFRENEKRTMKDSALFRFLLEELVYFLVNDDLLLEDVSTRFRRLNHLDALRVRASGVTGLQCCDRFLCHSSKPF